MQVLDYGRSFVTFVSQGGRYRNNARLQIESRTTLTDTQSGESTRYLFFASCKSEDTFAPTDLFYNNNYDFNGIFSEKEYVIFRTYSQHTARFREEGLWKGTFNDVSERLVQVDGTVLNSGEEVVRASMAGKPLVGRVELASDDGSLSAEIEFPVKTMNANDIQVMYQVDTGPIPFPELDGEFDLDVERFRLAFVAYNVPDFADFVLQVKTPVRDREPAATPHYSEIRSLKAENQVLRVD